MWRQRDLSLIGKITILKSLAFSKIIYQCGVLIAPPDFIEQINDLAYGFVWNNKPDKIKRMTLISDYSQGGLRMLDISSFLKAQKVMWAKRLLSPDIASWKALPRLFFENQLGLDIFKCNMKCTNKPDGFPEFYWQILKAWFEVKTLIGIDVTPVNIRKQCLWLNENIKIGKKVLFWKDWHKTGINIIHDIINKHGSFLSTEDIERNYNIKCSVLKYNKLKDAIPKDWRKQVKTIRIEKDEISFNDQIFLNINNIPKSLKNITNKDIYWIFIKSIQIKAVIIDKLEYSLGITSGQWKTIFLIPKTVKNTKIKTFQYKVLFNLIPCNLYLYRITKSDTDKCDKCGKLDDIMHYFCECYQMVTFWSSFSRWWENMMNQRIQLDQKTILVGCITNNNNFESLNACILIAKWHIYKNKLNNDLIFFYKFLCELKYAIMIEKNIAVRNNQLQKHNEIWGKIEDHLT